MRWLLLVFPLFRFSAFSSGAGLVLEWDPVGEGNIAGYRVHCGPISRGTNEAFNYAHVIDVGPGTALAITASRDYKLYPVTWFAVSAYDIAGVDILYSDEIFYTKGPPPAPPPIVLNIPPTARGWIQTSEDLNAWTTITYTEGGTFTFPIDVTAPQRYYRFKPDEPLPLAAHKTKTGHR